MVRRRVRDRRRAPDEELELPGFAVEELQRRAGVDADDAATLDAMPLGRLAQRDRQRSLEHEEDLFLAALRVPAALRARRKAPDPRPRPLERRCGREIGEPTVRGVVDAGAVDPFESVGMRDAEAHGRTFSQRRRYGAAVILVVAATEAELAGAPGETFVCGVGPVDAAARTGARLALGLPDGLLHVGLAGARGFTEVAVVAGSEAVYCDADDPRWVEQRLAPDPRLLAAVRRALPDARVEPIGTSAHVGGSSGCAVEAMEGFAVLRAAALAGVPAVEVRVLANEIAEPDRARWQLADAREQLAAALPALVEAAAGA